MNDETVVAYLKENPEFFVRQPGVLEALELRHEASGAESLIEHQVVVLRERLAELQQRLDQFRHRAQENEAVLRRVHDLYLALVRSADSQRLLADFSERMRHDFNCDACRIVLLHEESELETIPGLVERRESEAVRALAARGIVCGRLATETLSELFDEDTAAQTRSTAVVPLGDWGLLALASGDEDKFYPGMGTLFLELMGLMLEQSLRATGATEQPEGV